MCVSEIRVNQIRVNQGLGVIYELPLKQKEKCGRRKGKLHLQWFKIISE